MISKSNPLIGLIFQLLHLSIRVYFVDAVTWCPFLWKCHQIMLNILECYQTSGGKVLSLPNNLLTGYQNIFAKL